MGIFDGIVGSVIGGVASWFGGKDTNDTNVDIHQMDNQFNAEQADRNRLWQQGMWERQRDVNIDEAQKQRDWQTTMSNTQYQRAVGDMEAAGLNPMLAYSQGGAGTPSGGQASVGGPSGGSTASAQSPPLIQNKLTAAINSAGAIADLANKLSSADLIAAQVAKTKADTDVATNTASKIPVDQEYVFQSTQKLKYEISQVITATDEAATRIDLNKARTRLTKMEEQLAAGQITLNDAREELTRTENQLSKYRLAGAKNQSEHDETGWGAAMPYLTDATKLINAAATARFGFRAGRSFED